MKTCICCGAKIEENDVDGFCSDDGSGFCSDECKSLQGLKDGDGLRDFVDVVQDHNPTEEETRLADERAGL